MLPLALIEGEQFTVKYLNDVKHHRVWFSITEYTRLRACARKPLLKVLLWLIKDITEENSLVIDFRNNKVPDSRWLLEVIATLGPDTHIFDKGHFTGMESK